MTEEHAAYWHISLRFLPGLPFIIDLQAAFETTENFILVFVSSQFSSCRFN